MIVMKPRARCAGGLWAVWCRHTVAVGDSLEAAYVRWAKKRGVALV